MLTAKVTCSYGDLQNRCKQGVVNQDVFLAVFVT